MKRYYSKPEIVFESFTLSTNIAGTCDRIVGNPTQGTCGIPGDGPESNIFSSTVGGAYGCHLWDESGVYDGFCYHNPNGEDQLFNS